MYKSHLADTVQKQSHVATLSEAFTLCNAEDDWVGDWLKAHVILETLCHCYVREVRGPGDVLDTHPYASNISCEKASMSRS